MGYLNISWKTIHFSTKCYWFSGRRWLWAVRPVSNCCHGLQTVFSHQIFLFPKLLVKSTMLISRCIFYFIKDGIYVQQEVNFNLFLVHAMIYIAWGVFWLILTASLYFINAIFFWHTNSSLIPMPLDLNASIYTNKPFISGTTQDLKYVFSHSADWRSCLESKVWGHFSFLFSPWCWLIQRDYYILHNFLALFQQGYAWFCLKNETSLCSKAYDMIESKSKI